MQGTKQERNMEIFMSQRNSKFTLAYMIDGLSLAIFANNGIYIAITFFVGLTMSI